MSGKKDNENLLKSIQELRIRTPLERAASIVYIEEVIKKLVYEAAQDDPAKELGEKVTDFMTEIVSLTPMTPEVQLFFHLGQLEGIARVLLQKNVETLIRRRMRIKKSS